MYMKKIMGIISLAVTISQLVYAPIDTTKIPSLLEGKDHIIPVAVIGSGPAGLAAAIPAARSGYHTVIFQGIKPGGELADAQTVENWPGMPTQSGALTMKKLEEQVSSFGAHLVPLVIDDIDVRSWPYKLQISDGTTAYALTVIIATGANQKKLGIPGEDTYWGKGLFTCGLCDGTYARGKETAIIGGGDMAIERALQLRPEAKKVTLIVAEPQLTAHKSMQEKIKGIASISVLYNKEVQALVGSDTAITHLELIDKTTQEKLLFPTSSVFLSSGLTPNTELVINKLPLEKDGCIALKGCHSQQTDLEGIMAAGTVSDSSYRQVAAITGDGTKAGMDAVHFLSKWGFDGPRRELLSKNVYKIPLIPHPHIKKIASLYELNRYLRGKKPVLVEIYSPACSSCRKMEGPLTKATEELKDDLVICKINKDNDKLYYLVEKYDLNLIPAFLLFKNGREVLRIEGEMANPQFEELIKKSLTQAPQKA